MDRVYVISKEELSKMLKEGKTTKQIEAITGIKQRTVSTYAQKYGISHLFHKRRYPIYKLGTIDTKEKAYMLGFIIADSSISHSCVEVSVQKNDKDIMEVFSKELGIQYRIDDTIDYKSRRFSRVRINRKISDINLFVGGDKKSERNVPIIRRDLEVYMIRGIFDADGCITWGRRKDRNRIWHKVSFTSQLSILVSVQKVLYKIGISTTIKPKSKCDCFILEFANKEDVIKFYNYLYADKDFIPLKRKFDKFEALRLELGGFSGSIKENVILSRAVNLFTECAETTGELNGVLNNQSSTQDL